MTTIQGNKLIAKFLTKQTGKKITTSPTRMNYHSNWNSLMSVRDQVTALGNVDVIMDGNCTITWDDGTTYYNTVKKGSGTERTAVWTAIVELLEWYDSVWEAMANQPEVVEEPATETV